MSEVAGSPPDARVEQLTEHVRQISLPVSTLPPYDHTNGFLIADNGVGLLVDPVCEGDDSLALLRRVAADAGVRLLKGVVLTHTHPDHVVGLEHVLAAFDGPTLYLHTAEATRLPPDLGPVVAVQQDRVLTVGDVTAELLHTPGHSPGHLAVAVRSAPGDVLEAVLAGDLVAAESSVWVGVPEGDVSAYLASLERLERLDPPVIGAGHGPALRAPLGRLAQLKEHRLERERQVLAALESAGSGLSAAAITAQIYPPGGSDQTAKVVADLARRSVLAHLAKSVAEGVVSRSTPADDALFTLSKRRD